MKDNEFITSDLHLGHRAVIKYSGRPFSSVEEMDRAIIDNWNRKVPMSATVYLLGDVSFYSNDKTRILLGQLNGTIRIIRGNHDKKNSKQAIYERAEWVRDYYESYTEDGTKVCMFHYPQMTWNKGHYGSWHLHGHSHGSLGQYGPLHDLLAMAKQMQSTELDENGVSVGLESDGIIYAAEQFKQKIQKMLDNAGGRRMDVGIDCHPNFEPFSFEEVAEFMKNKEYVMVDHHKSH